MSILELLLSPAVVIIVLVLLVASGVKILREYERAVIFRLGRVARAIWNPGGTGNGPGIVLIIPGIDKMVKVGLRTVTMDVPAQDVITRDNVSVKVNAIIYFRVIDAQRAILQVEDFLYATQQIAQTTLRSVLGQGQLDDLLAKRDEINSSLQRIIDQQTEPWGIKVTAVEVKNVDLPQEMVRAIAKQAEAERERRSKVIHAEGEYQAAQKLADSAEILGRHPAALQLRFLQTLANITSEKNSVTIFPVPIDLLTPFLKREDKGS
jgi:regulator of protease activity HflC (stomatin/prohibitin superfamily)